MFNISIVERISSCVAFCQLETCYQRLRFSFVCSVYVVAKESLEWDVKSKKHYRKLFKLS